MPEILKEKTWRFDRYLEFVRTLPCCRCETTIDIQAHHIKGVGHFSGGALKAPDWASMPVCPACHLEIHRSPSLWPLQWEWISRTLGKWVEQLTMGILP
ncbi:MAG: DUF968 domain-containing protein [Pseudomonadota bacterium]|nr:DUF968 domain-containing protein [Pseudomonadota bacterium]